MRKEPLDKKLMKRAIFLPLTRDIQLSGDIGKDATLFLQSNGRPKTADHCRKVAHEARKLAARFGVDGIKAEIAGWLHDASAVFPLSEQIQIARLLDIEILPEEKACPMILHQKISAVMASDIFCIDDPAIISAIGCHTTLKAGASALDKVVFIADKVQWDQPGQSPWSQRLLDALEESLDKAVRVYLDYLWQQRQSLAVIHPWMMAAYHEYAI